MTWNIRITVNPLDIYFFFEIFCIQKLNQIPVSCNQQQVLCKFPVKFTPGTYILLHAENQRFFIWLKNSLFVELTRYLRVLTNTKKSTL